MSTTRGYPFGLHDDFFNTLRADELPPVIGDRMDPGAKQSIIDMYLPNPTEQEARIILAVCFNTPAVTMDAADMSDDLVDKWEAEMEAAQREGDGNKIQMLQHTKEEMQYGNNFALLNHDFFSAEANEWIAYEMHPFAMLDMCRTMGISLTTTMQNWVITGQMDRVAMKFYHDMPREMRENMTTTPLAFFGEMAYGYLRALDEDQHFETTKKRVFEEMSKRGAWEESDTGKGDLDTDPQPSPPEPESFESVMARTEPHDDRSGAPPLAEAQPGRRRVPDPPRGRGRERRARE